MYGRPPANHADVDTVAAMLPVPTVVVVVPHEPPTVPIVVVHAAICTPSVVD